MSLRMLMNKIKGDYVDATNYEYNRLTVLVQKSTQRHKLNIG